MHVCQPEFYVCMKQTEQLKIYVYYNNINNIINCDILLTAKISRSETSWREPSIEAKRIGTVI